MYYYVDPNGAFYIADFLLLKTHGCQQCSVVFKYNHTKISIQQFSELQLAEPAIEFRFNTFLR